MNSLDIDNINFIVNSIVKTAEGFVIVG